MKYAICFSGFQGAPAGFFDRILFGIFGYLLLDGGGQIDAGAVGKLKRID
ncbi:MAG: hypothetical protein ACFBZ8_01175 [Opitutales bacterium]